MTKEHPILMSGEMVRAILEDHKTQTRRVIRKINGFREFFFDDDRKIIDAQSMLTRRGPNVIDSYGCPYGQVGDRLWIRETFMRTETGNIIYRADMPDDNFLIGDGEDHIWIPSIFMPKAVCRLYLEITSVRAERLQTISETDARAEGVAKLYRTPRWLDGEAQRQYETLWDKINGKRTPWSSNPWVWCLSFKRLESTK